MTKKKRISFGYNSYLTYPTYSFMKIHDIAYDAYGGYHYIKCAKISITCTPKKQSISYKNPTAYSPDLERSRLFSEDDLLIFNKLKP